MVIKWLIALALVVGVVAYFDYVMERPSGKP